MVIDFTVSEQAACVQGHFPGAPVVPGAYLLARLDLALRELLPQRRLVAMGKVKFLAPLLPDVTAQLHLVVEDETRAQLRITHGEILVLQASARLE